MASLSDSCLACIIIGLFSDLCLKLAGPVTSQVMRTLYPLSCLIRMTVVPAFCGHPLHVTCTVLNP